VAWSSVDQLEIPRLRGVGKPKQHPILVIPTWESSKRMETREEMCFDVDKNTFVAPRCGFSSYLKQEVPPVI
jgi:hypothetical protein